MSLKKHLSLCLIPFFCLSLAGTWTACDDDDNNNNQNQDNQNQDNQNQDNQNQDNQNQGNQNQGNTNQWPDSLKLLTSYPDFYAFIPEGVFAYKSPNGETGRLIAKSADGALTIAEIDTDKDHPEKNKRALSWQIWKGHEYWSLHHMLEEDENNIDHDVFFYDHMDYPMSEVTTNPLTLDVQVAWEWDNTSVYLKEISPLLGYNDLLNFPSNKATNVGDEDVMGVKTHKYVYDAYIGEKHWHTSTWWVLDNGMPVKYEINYVDSGLGNESMEPVILQLGSASYEEVMQKYLVFLNQLGSETPAIADMVRQTECDGSGEWIAPDNFEKWEHGNIDFSTIFRAMNWKGYPVYKMYIKMKPGTDLKSEAEAYGQAVIEHYQLDKKDECIQYGEYDLGCKYEFSYSKDDCPKDYSFYRIETTGTGISGNETPSTPSVIFAEHHKCQEI